MTFKRFEEIPVWKESIELTRKIHELTSSGAFSKDFALRDQIRRAVISISSNIVEGYERNNNREFIRYLIIAKASAAEVRNQIYLAILFRHLEQAQAEPVIDQLIRTSSSITGFISYLKRFLNTSSKSPNPRLR